MCVGAAMALVVDEIRYGPRVARVGLQDLGGAAGPRAGLGADAPVPLERGVGERHQLGPVGLHLLGYHLDLALRE
jgi:hypothetical protein